MVYAHSHPTSTDTTLWEPLADHLNEVGEMGAEFAEAFGLAPWARAAGLLHDIGKVSAAYQNYITRGRNVKGPKGPDHSTAGARVAVHPDRYGRFGKMLGFAIAGHHSGLMNGSGFDGAGRSLSDRLDPAYNIENFDGWEAHAGDLPPVADLAAALAQFKPSPHCGLTHFFAIRMIFSCLVDADFIATERYDACTRGRSEPERGGKIGPHHLTALETSLADKRSGSSKVNVLRSKILDSAVAKAKCDPGLFTLTVPTGGGKTLTSLNFALKHALHHGKQRIIYVIPFTSIIEQTAAVFREVLKTPDDILEHHSSFDWDACQPTREGDQEGEGRAGHGKLQRASENWDAPIVVTTAVQFFETLFARRTSRCRKLHNIANSVIVIDEAQTMPVHLLRPTMAALDELARNYGASIVLCTATQPALREIDGALPKRSSPALPVDGFAIDEERELAPDPAALFAKLKRVEIERLPGPIADDVIADRFADQAQMLCIVNSRRHAQDLYARIAQMPGTVHLSTLMCARHRRAVLERVRAALKAEEPVRLVATSLIEAGVDIDFPEVWRAATGLDSIAQAAGRCNREGKRDKGRTVVFTSVDQKVPKDIQPFWQAGQIALQHAADAGADPLGPDAMRDYFQHLYFNKGYAALDAATRDGKTYAILPDIKATRSACDFPFALVSDAYRLIDDVMEPVLIPWDDDGENALRTLRQAPVLLRSVLRKLQQYTVSVPARARQELMKSGAVQAIRPEEYGDRFLMLASKDHYSEALGLNIADAWFRSAESNVF